ncbi:MAG: glucose-6-phosphate isomerase, partial [Chitinophagaceae bacterium]|nr:glucose-6-phosphate isomerase [Chitinophagaceae bacterium]
MFPRVNPTTTPAWHALLQHNYAIRNIHMKDIFKNDPDRFKKYAYCLNDIVVDLSKNIVTDETMGLLRQLASECNVKEAIDAMFSGELINETEQRSVLHVALRNFSGKPIYSEGKNVMEDVHRVQNQMKNFCSKVHNGQWVGYTGKKIKYIVNIGSGGS